MSHIEQAYAPSSSSGPSRHNHPSSRYHVDTRYSIHIDPRSHLEVSDKYHRYAKNLRIYFQEYAKTINTDVQEISSPQHDSQKWTLFERFFIWLDESVPKPEVQSCPRSCLESDVVRYITDDDERLSHLIHIDKNGFFWKRSNDIILSNENNINVTTTNTLNKIHNENIFSDTTSIPNNNNNNNNIHTSDMVISDTCTSKQPPIQLQNPSLITQQISSSFPLSSSPSSSTVMSLLNTGSEGWIFIIRSGLLFAHYKETKTFPRFHHSTFFSGEDVEFAGMLVCENGQLTRLYPHSGHYRPQEKHLRYMLLFLKYHHVNMDDVVVDAQRIFHVARIMNKDGDKIKKVEAAHMVPIQYILDLLEWKYRCQELGLLHDILDAYHRQQHRLNMNADSSSNDYTQPLYHRHSNGIEHSHSDTSLYSHHSHTHNTHGHHHHHTHTQSHKRFHSHKTSSSHHNSESSKICTSHDTLLIQSKDSLHTTSNTSNNEHFIQAISSPTMSPSYHLKRNSSRKSYTSSTKLASPSTSPRSKTDYITTTASTNSTTSAIPLSSSLTSTPKMKSRVKSISASSSYHAPTASFMDFYDTFKRQQFADNIHIRRSNGGQNTTGTTTSGSNSNSNSSKNNTSVKRESLDTPSNTPYNIDSDNSYRHSGTNSTNRRKERAKSDLGLISETHRYSPQSTVNMYPDTIPNNTLNSFSPPALMKPHVAYSIHPSSDIPISTSINRSKGLSALLLSPMSTVTPLTNTSTGLHPPSLSPLTLSESFVHTQDIHESSIFGRSSISEQSSHISDHYPTPVSGKETHIYSSTHMILHPSPSHLHPPHSVTSMKTLSLYQHKYGTSPYYNMNIPSNIDSTSYSHIVHKDHSDSLDFTAPMGEGSLKNHGFPGGEDEKTLYPVFHSITSETSNHVLLHVEDTQDILPVTLTEEEIRYCNMHGTNIHHGNTDMQNRHNQPIHSNTSGDYFEGDISHTFEDNMYHDNYDDDDEDENDCSEHTESTRSMDSEDEQEKYLEDCLRLLLSESPSLQQQQPCPSLIQHYESSHHHQQGGMIKQATLTHSISLTDIRDKYSTTTNNTYISTHLCPFETESTTMILRTSPKIRSSHQPQETA